MGKSSCLMFSWLFTRLSLLMPLIVSFVMSFFPRDVLNGIWNLIESLPENFPTYSFKFIVETNIVSIAPFIELLYDLPFF